MDPTFSFRTQKFQFQFSFKMAYQRSERPMRAPPRLPAVSPRLPSNQCRCLVEHKSFPRRVECRPLPFSTFSILQVISAVMLWPVHVSESSSSLGAPLPCQAADQMWYLLCLPVIPNDTGMTRAVDPQKSLQFKTMYGCEPVVEAAHSRLHLLQQIYWVCENDGIFFQLPLDSGNCSVGVTSCFVDKRPAEHFPDEVNLPELAAMYQGVLPATCQLPSWKKHHQWRASPFGIISKGCTSLF